MPADTSPDLPRLVLRPSHELEYLLRRLERLLARDPAGARIFIGALVAEGRRFAATPEGHRWREALAGSQLVRQGRIVWQACGLNRLTATVDHQTLVLSDWLRLTAGALTSADLETVLARRLIEEAEDGVGNVSPVPLGERLR
jgi:hypothetical protein